jgi:hypothetical protein
VWRAPGEGSFDGGPKRYFTLKVVSDGIFIYIPKRYVKKGTGYGHLFPLGPTFGEHGCSFHRNFEIKRYIKRNEYVKMPCKLISVSVGALLESLEGICLLGLFG